MSNIFIVEQNNTREVMDTQSDKFKWDKLYRKYQRNPGHDDRDGMLQRCADNGHCVAQYLVALQYLVKDDIEQGKHWLMKSAKNGYIQAEWKLGSIYKEEGNNELAYKFLLRAARKGSSSAMFELYLINKEDVFWLDEAARAGHTTAMLNILFYLMNKTAHTAVDLSNSVSFCEQLWSNRHAKSCLLPYLKKIKQSPHYSELYSFEKKIVEDIIEDVDLLNAHPRRSVNKKRKRALAAYIEWKREEKRANLT